MSQEVISVKKSEMFPACVEYHIETHSPEWFQFRTVGIPDVYEGGIGASETAKICGYDPYSPVPIQLHHHKVGTEHPEMWDNERMLHGRISEPMLIDFGQLYDGTTESIVKNYERFIAEGRPDHMKTRKIHRVRSYLVNPKYPWLFVSLDAAFDKDGYSIRDGSALSSYCPNELKTIGEQQAKQYDAGFPPKYTYQINQQMLVTESDYGEISVLKDGKYFSMHGFPRDEEICAEILDKTKRFWDDHVVPGRAWFKTYKEAMKLGAMEEAKRAWDMVYKFEPRPDHTDETRKYLTKRVVEASDDGISDKMRGSIVDYISARHYLGLNEVKKVLDGLVNKKKSEIMQSMADQGVRFINFGDDGKVQVTRGNQFRCDLQVDLSVEAIKAVNKMNLKSFE